jgi:hypothetical protein
MRPLVRAGGPVRSRPAAGAPDEVVKEHPVMPRSETQRQGQPSDRWASCVGPTSGKPRVRPPKTGIFTASVPFGCAARVSTAIPNLEVRSVTVGVALLSPAVLQYFVTHFHDSSTSPPDQLPTLRHSERGGGWVGNRPFDVGGFPSTSGQVGVAKNCADAPPSKGASPDSAVGPDARSPTPESEPPRIRPPSLPAGIEPDACWA